MLADMFTKSLESSKLYILRKGIGFK